MRVRRYQFNKKFLVAQNFSESLKIFIIFFSSINTDNEGLRRPPPSEIGCHRTPCRLSHSQTDGPGAQISASESLGPLATLTNSGGSSLISSSCPRIPLVPVVLKPSDFYTTSFPGSQACGQQVVGLLSLHNHVSQFLTISLSLFSYVDLYVYASYRYISPIFFSGEP